MESLNRQGRLTQLIEASETSRRMWRTVAACLPETLRQHTLPSKYQNQVWVLLAETSAIAAKLRHCLPEVLSWLFNAGFDVREVQIHIAEPRPMSTQVLVPTSAPASACPDDVRRRLAEILAH